MKTYIPVSILLLGVTVAAAPAAEHQSGKGLSMIMTTTMSMAQMPKPTVVIMAQIRVSSSGKARADWLPTDSAGTPAPAPHPATGDRPPILQPGTYSIGKKGNDTTFIVDPAQKKVWVMLKSDNAANLATAQKIVHDDYVDVDVSAQRIQPDSTVAGIAVQHWRVVDNHTQKSHAFGTTNTTIFKANYEFYSAPEFEIAGFSPAEALASVGGATGDTAYSAKLRAAMAKAMPGYPLLMRTQMQILTNKGKTTSVSMAMLCSNISRVDPPASTFVVPSGYTTVRASLMAPTVTPGATGAGTTAAPAAPAGVAGMPHVSGDTTTHASVLDTASKQAGTDATNNAGQAVKQKLKSVIHFP